MPMIIGMLLNTIKWITIFISLLQKLGPRKFIRQILPWQKKKGKKKKSSNWYFQSCKTFWRSVKRRNTSKLRCEVSTTFISKSVKYYLRKESYQIHFWTQMQNLKQNITDWFLSTDEKVMSVNWYSHFGIQSGIARSHTHTQGPAVLEAVSKLTHMDMCSNMFMILYKQPTYQSATKWKRVCILYMYIYVDL